LGFGRKDVNGKTKISLNHDVLLTSADADEYFDHTGFDLVVLGHSILKGDKEQINVIRILSSTPILALSLPHEESLKSTDFMLNTLDEPQKVLVPAISGCCANPLCGVDELRVH
jgi:hypothetical protein